MLLMDAFRIIEVHSTHRQQPGAIYFDCKSRGLLVQSNFKRNVKSCNVQKALKIPLHMGVGAALAYLLTKPSRLIFGAGATVTVGRVRQLDDAAAGCGGGVGLTPWCQVDVPLVCHD
jgi:hypothetical protein